MLNAKRKIGRPSNKNATEYASSDRINAAKAYTTNVLSPNLYLSAVQNATTSTAYNLNNLALSSVSVMCTNDSTYNFRSTSGILT